LKRIVPIGLMGIGVYWCIMSIQYGLWVRKGPGGGFLPMLAGILAILIGIWVVKDSFKETDLGKFNKKVFLPIGVMLAIAILSEYIGLICAIVIYLFCWLRFYSKVNLKTTILITIICPCIVYAIFIMWLKVPVPTGIFGRLM